VARLRDAAKDRVMRPRQAKRAQGLNRLRRGAVHHAGFLIACAALWLSLLLPVIQAGTAFAESAALGTLCHSDAGAAEPDGGAPPTPHHDGSCAFCLAVSVANALLPPGAPGLRLRNASVAAVLPDWSSELARAVRAEGAKARAPPRAG
jgi:hypothetical protein